MGKLFRELETEIFEPSIPGAVILKQLVFIRKRNLGVDNTGVLKDESSDTNDPEISMNYVGDLTRH